jgi:hypothetical protein
MAITPRTIPKTTACSGSTAWAGSGRRRVRVMRRSMSRSRYWLMAFALPAARVPPTSVQATSQPQSTQSTPGRSRVARTIAGTVVMRRSSMIRGLVRAM